MRHLFFIVCSSALLSCHSQTSVPINTSGKTIETRFSPPPGFSRDDDATTTFDNFLRACRLKAAGAKVLTYKGDIKYPDNIYEAVLDIDIGAKDLQQCADAVMRLRAEYLFANKMYNKIHFDFTNGKKAEYVKYAEGYRYSPKSNSWIKTAEKNYSYEAFRSYMDLVFNYSGSLSLSRELKPVSNVNDIKPGDVFVKGGSPGHAVIVMDVVINKTTKQRSFMIAQSYMPAQNIHVLKKMDDANSPWYDVNFGEYLKTPEWTFSKDQLMRFDED